MKNNRGFTLIELLAVIVLLGILFGLSIPLLINTIHKNKNKIYIEDAKKMITQAEYKMSSNSASINKPKAGECIVFSLKYIDNGSFTTAPNDGNYSKTKSFVVVRNVGGNFVYDAMIVEESNNNYIGVPLTTFNDLNSNNSYTKVRALKSNEVIESSSVTKNYINSKISGSNVSKVLGIYS